MDACLPSDKSTFYTVPVQFIGSMPNKLLTLDVSHRQPSKTIRDASGAL
jgi:hypothetical protein